MDSGRRAREEEESEHRRRRESGCQSPAYYGSLTAMGNDYCTTAYCPSMLSCGNDYKQQEQPMNEDTQATIEKLKRENEELRKQLAESDKQCEEYRDKYWYDECVLDKLPWDMVIDAKNAVDNEEEEE